MPTIQAHATTTGAFNSSDRYCCRIVIPSTHKLTGAALQVQNVVLTGTVTVLLKQTDPGDARGGSTIDTLAGSDFTAAASLCQKVTFDLSSYRSTAPEDRQYFLVMTATDSADRLDEPVLVLTYTEV